MNDNCGANGSWKECDLSTKLEIHPKTAERERERQECDTFTCWHDRWFKEALTVSFENGTHAQISSPVIDWGSIECLMCRQSNRIDASAVSGDSVIHEGRAVCLCERSTSNVVHTLHDFACEYGAWRLAMVRFVRINEHRNKLEQIGLRNAHYVDRRSRSPQHTICILCM